MHLGKLVKKLRKECLPDLTISDVRVILDEIAASLGAGERVQLKGFGTFRVSTTPEFERYNHRKGEMITVPSQNVVRFKAGKRLKARINP